MGRIVQPATFVGEAPPVLSGKYKTSEAIYAGSLLVIDSNGELTVCGTDPAIVDGIALEPAGSKPGWDAANSPLLVTGRVQEVSYAIPGRTTWFSARVEDGSSNLVALAQTNVDEEYGITKDSNGEWYINTAKTGADARVRIRKISALDTNIAFFSFLEAIIPSN